MKSLDEKKLLVKMARMLGQPVDPALLESIEREEKLAVALFGEKKGQPQVKVIPESKPPINVPIIKDDVIEVRQSLEQAQPPEEKKPLEEKKTEVVKVEKLPPQEEKPAETGVQNLNVPDENEEDKVREQFNDGLLSEEEQYQKVIEIWEQAKLHDHGLCNELTHNCKLLQMIWKEGYEDALNQVTQLTQRSALYFAEPAGSA